jgi:hypothetical protein
MKTNGCILTCLGVLLIAGCAADQCGDDFFVATDGSNKMNRAMAVQAASGAAADATLYAFHFNGDQLNSNGEAAIDQQIALVREGAPKEIYLDIKGDISARSDAVLRYLQSRGIEDGTYTVVQGYRPGNTSPAAVGLKGLVKQETSDSSDDGGSEGMSSAR